MKAGVMMTEQRGSCSRPEADPGEHALRTLSPHASLDMSNLQPSWMILAQNAPFIYSYLVLKLGLKMSQLINHFVKVPQSLPQALNLSTPLHFTPFPTRAFAGGVIFPA